MKIPFSGGCACGAVRYEVSAQPVEMFLCHCANCQKASGSAFTSVVLVPAGAFRIVRGEVRDSVLSGQDGNMRRGFCCGCGSPLLGRSDGFPFVGIAAGSLDEPGHFDPSSHIFSSHARSWHPMSRELAQFEEFAPQP